MTLTDRVAFVLGTWFGCGESKVAPGTVGSIGAVPLHFLLQRLPIGLHWSGILALSLMGIWASERMARALHAKDPQRVVIDEVAGTLIAMGMVGDFSPWAGVAALVVFRIFDITKPGPIRRAEDAQPPGLGIMLDDLLAGACAGAVTRLGALAVGHWLV
jgi:phosphatidylglycerophosphatase A